MGGYAAEFSQTVFGDDGRLTWKDKGTGVYVCGDQPQTLGAVGARFPGGAAAFQKGSQLRLFRSLPPFNLGMKKEENGRGFSDSRLLSCFGGSSW